MTTNETENGKRNRRTRKEMLEAARAKLAKLEAQVAGTWTGDESDDNYMAKRLKAAIRRRETAIKNAETLLKGRAATKNSPAVSDIDTKIKNAEKRLSDMRDAKNRANEILARVPFDVETLQDALVKVDNGDEVEYPTGLYILPQESEKTEAEHEATLPGSESGGE